MLTLNSLGFFFHTPSIKCINFVFEITRDNYFFLSSLWRSFTRDFRTALEARITKAIMRAHCNG